MGEVMCAFNPSSRKKVRIIPGYVGSLQSVWATRNLTLKTKCQLQEMLTLTLSIKFAYDSSKEGVSMLTYTEERLSQWVGLPWIAAKQPASTPH